MLEVIFLALALSMDAFAVSIGLGVKKKYNLKALAIKSALLFGLFQSLMPLIGYIGGVGLKNYIDKYDNIIAFFLLLLIGSKMIYEAFNKNFENEITNISNKVLITLAIATSIDAMAAGFSLHLFSVEPFLSLIIIGLVTFVMTILGVYIGSIRGEQHQDKAEIFGGIILILIGIKILLEI